MFVSRGVESFGAERRVQQGRATCAEPDDADAIWIDVRTPQEFEADHLEGAEHIPWDGIEKGVTELGLSKEQPIYLYCGSGGRAGRAKESLEAAGYTAVVNAGGLSDARELSGAR